MRLHNKIGLFLCLFALALSSCKKQNDQNIKIGEFGSLSGSTATFGVSTHQGILLASEEINEQGGLLGKKVEVITEDDQGKAEEAKTAVLKLIKRDKVVAILGEVASSRSLAAAPEAQKAGIPMISPASTNPKVTEIGDYIFRTCFIDTFQGMAMAHFAYDKLQIRKVGILKDVKNDYSMGLAEFFEKTFKELGGEVVDVKTYSEGDREFRAPLTSLKAKNIEALYVPGYYTELGLIARQAKELGLTIPLLGGDGWDSEKTLQIGGDAVNGSYYSNHYSPEDPNPKVQSFIKKYQSKYQAVPDAMAVLGYDAAWVLFDAIKRAGTTEGNALKNAIAATQNFEGVSGNITIDAKRNAQKKIGHFKNRFRKS